MKYYVARRHPANGVQFQMNKCLDSKWCYAEYLAAHPKEVWQFSKQGATGIVKRYTEYESYKKWGVRYEYFIAPVDDVWAAISEAHNA